MGAEQSVSEQEVRDFVEAVDSNRIENVKKLLVHQYDNEILRKSDHGLVKQIIERKLNVDILRLALEQLWGRARNKVCNGATIDGKMVLFLAIQAGEEYLKAFKGFSSVNWRAFDEEGNNLLHYVYSKRCRVSDETVDFLLDKLRYFGVTGINDECENILHCAAQYGESEFFSCLNRVRAFVQRGEHEPTCIFVKKLVNTVNLNGETPFVKCLKSDDRNSDDINDDENYSILASSGYDFLKLDNDEENAISLAIKLGFSKLKRYLMNKMPDAFNREEKFVLLETNKLSELDDATLIREFCRQYPKRSAKFISEDETVLPNLFENGKLRFEDSLYPDCNNLLQLAIKLNNGELFEQCWDNACPELKKSTQEYVAKNKPEMYADFIETVELVDQVDYLDVFISNSSSDDLSHFLQTNKSMLGKSTQASLYIQEATFTTARDGDLGKLEVLIEYRSDVLYEKAMSIGNEKFEKSKSLLEVAAENRRVDVVLFLLQMQKGFGISKFFIKMPSETVKEKELIFKGFINDLLKRNEPWAQNLARHLAKNVTTHDRESEEAIEKILSGESDEKSFNIKTDYGTLKRYTSAIQSRDLSEFEETFKKKDYSKAPFKPAYYHPKLWTCLSHGNYGHNLITLTAAIGDVKHWQVLEYFFQSYRRRSTVAFLTLDTSASLTDNGTIGSPIQAAIKAGNNEMVHYFLKTDYGFDLNQCYGSARENILHTIVKEDRLVLFNDLFYKYRKKYEHNIFKSAPSKFIDALTEKNRMGETPLWLALKAKKFGLVNRVLNVALRNDKYIKQVLCSSCCGFIKTAVEIDAGAIIDKMCDLQAEFNETREESNHMTMQNCKSCPEMKVKMEKYYIK